MTDKAPEHIPAEVGAHSRGFGIQSEPAQSVGPTSTR